MARKSFGSMPKESARPVPSSGGGGNFLQQLMMMQMMAPKSQETAQIAGTTSMNPPGSAMTGATNAAGVKYETPAGPQMQAGGSALSELTKEYTKTQVLGMAVKNEIKNVISHYKNVLAHDASKGQDPWGNASAIQRGIASAIPLPSTRNINPYIPGYESSKKGLGGRLAGFFVPSTRSSWFVSNVGEAAAPSLSAGSFVEPKNQMSADLLTVYALGDALEKGLPLANSLIQVDPETGKPGLNATPEQLPNLRKQLDEAGFTTDIERIQKDLWSTPAQEPALRSYRIPQIDDYLEGQDFMNVKMQPNEANPIMAQISKNKGFNAGKMDQTSMGSSKPSQASGLSQIFNRGAQQSAVSNPMPPSSGASNTTAPAVGADPLDELRQLYLKK